MSNSHKKPTGDIGSVILLGAEGPSKVEPFKFPDTKDEIEKKIAQLFLKLVEKSEIVDLHGMTLVQNQENDLDFTLAAEERKFLLELTEITPPGTMKGGYENLPFSHNIGEQAQKIIDLISVKAAKYDSLPEGIILLTYISDQRSLPSTSSEKIVRQYLNSTNKVFSFVFLLFPLMEDDGPLITLFPNDSEPLSDEDLEALKITTVHNLKLDKAT